jgi:hypothetical protein
MLPLTAEEQEALLACATIMPKNIAAADAGRG